MKLMKKQILTIVAFVVFACCFCSCVIVDSPHYYRYRKWQHHFVPHPWYHSAAYRS